MEPKHSQRTINKNNCTTVNLWFCCCCLHVLLPLLLTVWLCLARFDCYCCCWIILYLMENKLGYILPLVVIVCGIQACLCERLRGESGECRRCRRQNDINFLIKRRKHKPWFVWKIFCLTVSGIFCCFCFVLFVYFFVVLFSLVRVRLLLLLLFIGWPLI